jgi:hypothetical protein
MSEKTITLKKPFLWHDTMVKELVIREPNAGEALRIGEPFEFRRIRDEMIPIDLPDAVSAYAELCIKHEGGKAVLRFLGVADARQIRDVIYGFFIPDPETGSATT